MSRVTDFEVTEAGTEALQIHSFLCYLPFGSAAASAAIINNKLEGPIFRNGLRLLREEMLINTTSLAPQDADRVRLRVANLELDPTRNNLIADILDYLTGCVEAFTRVAEWLASENILAESFTRNLQALKSA